MISNKQVRIPDWYSEYMEPVCEFISNLKPNPFDQPKDISNYISLHHNDYLRLGNHPSVVTARAKANNTNQVESFLSSVYGGSSDSCEYLCRQIKQCMQVDDVMLTTSGWAANVGLLEAITPLFKPVYIDNNAHASLYDGIKLSLGKKVPITHNDPDHLLEKININGPGVVCIDAVYSTDGSIGDIKRYVEICEEKNCVLILDEAHSFGMYGNGGGLAVELGLADRIPFRTVSLNKALGGHGGFIAGDMEMMQLVRARCRSVIFISATSSVSAAGHQAALKIIIKEKSRSRRCLDNAILLRKGLTKIGLDVSKSQCQIVSIDFDSEDEACQFYEKMRNRKILTSVFLYPATPQYQGLVRFSVHSELSFQEIDEVVACTQEVLQEMQLLAKSKTEIYSI
jgi:CAI-1 autoinducer synthase